MYVDELRFGRSVSGVDRAEKKKSTSFLRSDTRPSAKPNDLLVVEPVLYFYFFSFFFFLSDPFDRYNFRPDGNDGAFGGRATFPLHIYIQYTSINRPYVFIYM